MAQLKDLIVNGASRFIGDSQVNQIQIDSLKAKIDATTTTTAYGLGEDNQLLTSNGNNVYWQTPPFVHRSGDTMTGDLNLVVSENQPTPAVNFIRKDSNGNNDNYVDWRIRNSSTGIFSIVSRVTANGDWADRAWFETSNNNTTGTFVVDNIKLRNTPTIDDAAPGLNKTGAFLPIIIATTNTTAVSPSNIGELQVVKPNLGISWANGTNDGPIITTNLNGLSASATIPIATTAQSGVVTIESQNFAGKKFFKNGINTGNKNTYSDHNIGTILDHLGHLYLAGNNSGIIFQGIEGTGTIPTTTGTKITASTTAAIQVMPRLLIGTSASTYQQIPDGTSTTKSYSCVINNSDNNALYLKGNMAINSGIISSYSDVNPTYSISSKTIDLFQVYNKETRLALLQDIMKMSTTSPYSTTGTVELLLGSSVASGDNNVNGKITLYNTGSTIGSSLTGQRQKLGSTTQNCIVADYFQGTQVWGAVWNDYAEFRQTKEEIEPGRCIIETGEGDLVLSTKRLQNGAEIVSDTYGFAIGQTEKCNTPIASNGRVLAYLYENDKKILKQNIGQPVCSGPDGTVSIMTDQEARDYPWKIIGTISEIPNYEKWQIGNIEDNNFIDVNGRIWIRIR